MRHRPFSDEPKGRRIQIGWLLTATTGMPFNQSMSIPMELRLISTGDGPRLTYTPVKELEDLRAKSHNLGEVTVAEGQANPLAQITGELFELNAEFAPGDASEIAFNVRGVPVVFDARKQELIVNGQRAPAPLRDGKQRLTIFADRTCLEVFASDGLTYLPMPINLKPEEKSLAVTVRGGAAKFSKLDVHELRSIWKK
jgi:sucrose-6-phosphate hydrolase SacC (GH32 family)